MSAPVRARVRMYQVGFGDCFLLTFEYGAHLDDGRLERHVLIDFGTRKSSKPADMRDDARLIEQHCDGHLDAIVLTHRHLDHLSGFATEETAKIIDGLKPKLVVRPWTEDPKADADATGPVKHFRLGLARAQGFAEDLAAKIGEGARGLGEELREIAEHQVKNDGAVKRLDQWAKAGKGTYVNVGADSGLGKLLPGVEVSVLGPPTVDAWSRIAAAYTKSSPEYWFRLRQGIDLDHLPRAEAEEPAAPVGELGTVRWLVERMRDERLSLLHAIVTSLDAVLNNTSVILLFAAGEKRLLFGGDAQLENWQYVLQQFPKRAPLVEKLRRIDLYKVGHHGSRNATPKLSLFGLWSQADHLVSLVSTKSGVYPPPGAPVNEATKVPRASLLAALRKRGDLYSTDEDFKPNQQFLEVAAPLKGKKPFERV